MKEIFFRFFAQQKKNDVVREKVFHTSFDKISYNAIYDSMSAAVKRIWLYPTAHMIDGNFQ